MEEANIEAKDDLSQFLVFSWGEIMMRVKILQRNILSCGLQQRNLTFKWGKLSTRNNYKEDKEEKFLNQQTKVHPFHIFTFFIGVISLVISRLFQDPNLFISNMIILEVSKICHLLILKVKLSRSKILLSSYCI